MKLTIFFTVFVFLSNVYPATASSLKIGEVYKSLNANRAIEIISENKLKITRGQKIIVASYSVRGDVLRVALGHRGERRIKNFKIIPEGVMEITMGGSILYSPKKYDMGLLHKSARVGDMDMVKSLLDKGLDVNSKTHRSQTALMQAAMKGRTQIAKLLIAKGADLNAKSNYGSTALMKATKNGHLETVQLLIDQGADVNAENNRGSTALKIAKKRGHKKIALVLKNAGAME